MKNNDIDSELALVKEAEDAVIAALVFGKDSVYYQYSDRLHSDLFNNRHPKEVFKAISEIINDNDTINNFSIKTKLQNGSNEYFLNLKHKFDKDEFEAHLDYLNENFKRQVVNDLVNEAIRELNEGCPVDHAISRLVNQLNNIGKSSSYLIKISDAVQSVIEGISTRLSNPNSITGIPSGLTFFDDFSNGFQGGDLVIVAGETSQGKTALAVSMANSQGTQHQKPVLFISLEMTDQQLAGRLMSQETGISSKVLLSGRPTTQMLQHMNKNISRLVNSPIYIDNHSTTDINEIVALIHSSVAKFGIEIAYVDYLQLITSKSKSGTKEQEIADTCRLLKNTAKKLNIPIVLLSQLSRDRMNPKPTLARLRGSGQIEESADIVWFIWRPEYYQIDSIEMASGISVPSQDAAHSIIAKGRNIGITDFILNWDRERTLFSDYQNSGRVSIGGVTTSSNFFVPVQKEDAPF